MTGVISRFKILTRGSNLDIFDIILLPITFALSSVTGKNKISPKLIPNNGFRIFSPGDVVNKLIRAFQIAPTLLSDVMSVIC